MKNLILISNNSQKEFDTLDELKKYILSDLYNASIEEQKKYFYEKIFGFCIMNKLQIVDTLKGVYEGDYNIDSNERINFENAIVIDNIDTYIISLCKFNIIVLLESKNNLVYTKNIEEIENNEGEYIIVNKFANEILKELVGDAK